MKRIILLLIVISTMYSCREYTEYKLKNIQIIPEDKVEEANNYMLSIIKASNSTSHISNVLWEADAVKDDKYAIDLIVFMSNYYENNGCGGSPVKYQIPLDNMNKQQDSIYQILLTKPIGYSIKIKEYN